VPPDPDLEGAGRSCLRPAQRGRGGVARPRRRRLARAGALLPVAAVLGALAAPGMAWAVTAGSASIVQPGTLTNLDSGTADTPYEVALPSTASCPGDTAHQGYHVFSYLVPAGHTPAEVNFKHAVPNRWYGYFSYGSYYGAADTAEDTGQVVQLPEFSWTRYSTYPDLIFPGGRTRTTWEGGIACANTDGVVTTYWNTQIVFTKSATAPGGFTWRVIANPPVATSHTWFTVGIALLVVAVLFAVVAIVLNRRRPEEPGAPRGPDRSPRRRGRHAPATTPGTAEATDSGSDSSGRIRVLSTGVVTGAPGDAPGGATAGGAL
jgi:hypothetical protein